MDIQNIEIWKVGQTTDGRSISKKDIQDAYTATSKLLQEGYTIPVKLGHDDSGQIAHGWVSNLRVEGDSLYCDLNNLDDMTFKAIQEKRLPNRSIELFINMKWQDKTYGKVIKAVALLGTDTPALFLQPAMAYKYNDELYEVYSLEAISNNNINAKDYKKMDQIEILKTENEALRKELFEVKNTEIEKYQSELTQSKSDIEKYSTENKTLKEQYNAVLKQKDEYEAKFQAIEKQEIMDKLENDVIKKGKLLPTDKDKVVEMFGKLNWKKDDCIALIDTYSSVQASALTTEFGTQAKTETYAMDEWEAKFRKQLKVEKKNEGSK